VTDTLTTKTSLEPIPPLDLKAQWLSIKSEISAAINAVVESQRFVNCISLDGSVLKLLA
jgi:hypothetical protein